jgi:hypothetical protein
MVLIRFVTRVKPGRTKVTANQASQESKITQRPPDRARNQGAKVNQATGKRTSAAPPKRRRCKNARSDPRNVADPQVFLQPKDPQQTQPQILETEISSKLSQEQRAQRAEGRKPAKPPQQKTREQRAEH